MREVRLIAECTHYGFNEQLELSRIDGWNIIDGSFKVVCRRVGDRDEMRYNILVERESK